MDKKWPHTLRVDSIVILPNVQREKKILRVGREVVEKGTLYRCRPIDNKMEYRQRVSYRKVMAKPFWYPFFFSI